MSAELEHLRAEFEKFQSRLRQAQTQFSDVTTMREELTALEASATSPDRSVTVVAGPSGSIKDIQFTAEALRGKPAALAATLMSTLQQAVAESARQQAGIVGTHMGDTAPDGESVQDRVLEAQAEMLGTTVEDLRSKMPEQPSAGPAPGTDEGDDEEFGQGSVLSDGGGASPAPSPPSSGGGSAGDEFLANLFDDEEEQR